MACGPPCDVAVGCMRPSRKTITFSGRFFQSPPLPENRILDGPCGTARIRWRQLSPKRTKARQRGQRMAYRGKRRPARRLESKTGRGESISSAGVFVRNRRKSVCTSVCTFGFDGQNSPQCLRAVGLRLDFIVGRMRFYAPYAVALKGKALKKLQLRKEVHKVHTASCMCSQPYSRLASCLRAKSA